MPYANDTLEAYVEDRWNTEAWDATCARESVPVAPVSLWEKVAGFFGSMAASMALLRQTASRIHQPVADLSASDILAHNHPQLYLRVMCG